MRQLLLAKLAPLTEQTTGKCSDQEASALGNARPAYGADKGTATMRQVLLAKSDHEASALGKARMKGRTTPMPAKMGAHGPWPMAQLTYMLDAVVKIPLCQLLFHPLLIGKPVLSEESKTSEEDA